MLLKILISVAVVIVLLICGGVAVVFFATHELARDRQVDEQKLRPGVIQGEGRFERHEFYSDAGVGNISQILAGWPADREGAALTVIGNEGAVFLDAKGRAVKRISFSRNFSCPVEISRINASGDYGYLTRDESWASAVMMFDKDGKESWSYSGGLLKGIDDSVSLDIRGTSAPDVVVGLNGSSGILLLDGQGRPIWQKPEGNVWHVEVLDTNGDGQKEILHSDAQGQLLIRNLKGDIIARYLQGKYVSVFSVTRWKGDSEPNHLLVPVEESREGGKSPLFVLDASGGTVAQFDAPLGELMHGAKGTAVRFGKDAEYYAALLNKGVSARSVLLLYDKDGRIAYEEILGESCRGIAAVPAGPAERLLVGCSDRVLEYAPVLNATKPSH